MKDLLDSVLLRSLALVLETGSYSSAAKRLGVTQPAVSLRVQQLERQLGVRLVERSSRRLRATEAGALLLVHISLIDAAHSSALEALNLQARTRKIRVKLGASLTACLHFLPRTLGQLKTEHPEVEVSVINGTSTECARQVAVGTLDAAIVTLPVADALLDKTDVLHDDFVAIAGTGVPPMQPHLTFPILRAEPLLLQHRSSKSRRAIDMWFEENGGTRTPAMEFDCVETIKELVACGMGYGIVPRISLVGAGARSDLQVSNIQPSLSRTWALVTRKGRPSSREMNALCEAIALAGAAFNQLNA